MTEYKALIIYRKEWAYKWYAFIVFSLGLSAISNFYLHSKLLTILFLVLIFVSFLAIKMIMKYFTRNILIKLGEERISFTVFKLNDYAEESCFNFSFFEIKSYNILFPTSRFTSLIINLNSGIKKEFSFLNQENKDSQIGTNCIIESIHQGFKAFNLSQKQNAQIRFEPSFYASKRGLYTIVALVLLSIIPIVLAIKLDKNIPLTCVGVFLIIGQIMIRRYTDLSFYQKMIAE